MSEIKIFQLNDFDWWAGTDLESVKLAYLEEMGVLGPTPEEAFDEPHELSDAEMNTLHFIDGDDPINEDGTLGGSRTFRAQLQLMITRGEKFPCFFASTEF